MHPRFTVVSELPEILRVDNQNRPHAENGPSHRWRDGVSLYHWHGTRVPARWIEQRDALDPMTALTWPQIEQRRAAAEIIGWARVLEKLDAKVIDKDAPHIGTLLEVDLPDGGKQRFIRVECATKRTFALPVPITSKTAAEANASTWNLPVATFLKMAANRT
jgi:hypothetical protein